MTALRHLGDWVAGNSVLDVIRPRLHFPLSSRVLQRRGHQHRVLEYVAYDIVGRGHRHGGDVRFGADCQNLSLDYGSKNEIESADGCALVDDSRGSGIHNSLSSIRGASVVVVVVPAVVEGGRTVVTTRSFGHSI